MRRTLIIGLMFCWLLSIIPAQPIRSAEPKPHAPSDIPTTVLNDATGISGFELRGNTSSPNPTSSIHWWYTLGFNGCSGEFPNYALISWRSSLNTATKRLEEGCPPLLGGSTNVVRDDQYVYFFRNGQLSRKALNATTADPVIPLTKAPPLVGFLSTALAIDSSGYLYWATYASGNTVLRINRMKADNSENPTIFKQITPNGTANVSQIMVFTQSQISPVLSFYPGVAWIENGRLWRFYDNGGSGDTQLLASGITSFWAQRTGLVLTQSATFYAIQNANKVFRITMGGTITTLYDAPANTTLAGIAADGDYVYLNQQSIVCNPFCLPTDGAILRRSISGGAWDLIVADSAGSHLRSDGTNLYFTSFDTKSIKRISTDAAPLLIDIEALGVEITQAIQDMPHSFDLVAGHPTVARGYARVAQSNYLSQYTIDAKLVGKLNGVTLPESPLMPVSFVNVKTSTTLGDARTDTTLSFLFELPDTWTKYQPTGFPPQSNLTLEFSVNTNSDPPENASLQPYANNKTTRTIRTRLSTRPCLMMIPVRTYAPVPSHNPDKLPDMIARARAIMPVKNFRVFTNYTSTDLEDNWILSDDGDPYDLNQDNDDPEDDDDDGALDDLGDLDAWSSEWSNCTDLHWIGMLNRETDVGYGGIAYRDDNVLLAKMGIGTGDDPPFGPSGGTIMAHELGHNYGRRHIACGDFPDDQANFDFTPYDPCALFFTNLPTSQTMLGFDTITKNVIKPQDASDIMSYSSPKWASHQWWLSLMTAIPNFESRPAAKPTFANADPLLYVSGRVQDGATSGYLATVYTVPDGAAPAAAVALSLQRGAELTQQQIAASRTPHRHDSNTPQHTHGGPFTLRQVDASGAVLSSTAVVTSQTTLHSDNTHVLAFNQYIVAHPQTAKVQLLDGTTVLAERTRSTNAPNVDLQPLQRNQTAETVTMNWTASDPDQQSLTGMILFSSDNGTTWRALDTSITGFDATFNTKGFPGTNQARLRILVSDGFNTAIDTSEAFVINKHAPEPLIDGVVPDQRFAYGEAISFTGMALDPEDGSLDGEQLQWSLTGAATKTATGNNLNLYNVPPGNYTMTLQGTDSDGMTGTATRNFEVLPLAVPDAATPAFDGYCSDGSYADGAVVQISDTTQARLLHASGNVYVCFSGLSVNSFATNIAGIRFDANNSRDAFAQSDDRGFFVDEDGTPFQTVGNGTDMPITNAPADGYAAYSIKAGTTWSAELRIDESLIGGWNHLASIMFQANVTAHTNNANNWLDAAIYNKPNTWARATFGLAIVPSNRAPVADAGMNQTMAPHAPFEVYLDGSASYDPDLNPLSYAWTQTAGSSVILSNPMTETTHFTIQPVSTPTTYRFSLVVNDGQTNSVAKTVDIKVLPPKPQMNIVRVFIPVVMR